MMKELINTFLSSIALFLSLGAFLFTVIFQIKERKRNIRQTLTVALNEIVKINVDIAKLKTQENSEVLKKIDVIKNYNLQRAGSIIEADFLIHENPKVISGIDCKIMAITYEDIGNYIKADYYWTECISKSVEETERQINLGAYATFLFNQNKIDQGRVKFEEALKLKLDDRDDHRYIKAETYLTWSFLESSFGFTKEAENLRKLSEENCSKISNRNKRNKMKQQIEMVNENTLSFNEV